MKHTPDEVLAVVPYISDEALIQITDLVNDIVTAIDKKISEKVTNREYNKGLYDYFYAKGFNECYPIIYEIIDKVNIKTAFLSHLGRVLGDWWKYVKIDFEKGDFDTYTTISISIRYDPVSNKYKEVIH